MPRDVQDIGRADGHSTSSQADEYLDPIRGNSVPRIVLSLRHGVVWHDVYLPTQVLDVLNGCSNDSNAVSLP